MRIRPMNLKHAPTAENAPVFAQGIVASTARITGDVLDYSVESLLIVDQIIEGIRASGGTIDQYAETMFAFGCYVGEVFVRNAGGRWIVATDEQRKMFGMSLLVELPTQGRLCNAIAKPFKRLHNGIEDHLPYFYVAFTQPPVMSIVVPPKMPEPES